jgi:Fe-S-cluster containining protein
MPDVQKRKLLISTDRIIRKTQDFQPEIPVVTVNEEQPQKILNKYHLPVLYINDATQWENNPSKQRFTDEIAKKTCLENCCGYEGLKCACCMLDPNDLEHVLGKVDEQWIEDIRHWFKTTKKMFLSREDIVIDYEEGKLLGETWFNDHPVFRNEKSYPMLRIQVYGQRFVCKFLNVKSGMCTIYSQRPNMCKDYYCQYIKSNFLVRTRQNPNTYVNLKTDSSKTNNEKY